MIFLAHTTEGRWTPGIGDPSFGGWFTVFCYFAVAYLCYRNARAPGEGRNRDGLTRTWWVITSMLIFLGLNKQLDLQSLITQLGRQLAVEQGWYENRRALQRLFIMAIASAGITTLLLGGWILRRHLRSLALVFIGLTTLVTFIVIRAGSFHHVDSLLGYRIVGLRMNWLLELGGLAIVGLGAWRQRDRH
ncbi:MAG: hypothetical protein JXA30_07970 [Deltaproteobacteria bacterium]|nr:hypothetical protein [Deltaproteobacteria bacterium]